MKLTVNGMSRWGYLRRLLRANDFPVGVSNRDASFKSR